MVRISHRKARCAAPMRALVESLEPRALLSGDFFGSWSGGFRFGGFGHSQQTIQFSQAPAAVQSALDTLASTDNLAAPIATQTVYMANSNGIESYTIDIHGTGTNTMLTVDTTGAPVSKPVTSSTTFGAITNTAVTTEFNTIATALNLTAPASTSTVHVVTPASGNAVYTMNLTSGTGWHRHSVTISVDSTGNPVGNEVLPFSTLLPAVQDALNSNAPAGATPLTDTSRVRVQTLDGVTTYSATFNTTGVRTTVTVDAKGNLASLPSTSTVAFSTLSSTVQTELQTLATADGYTGTISTTQNVTAYNEANGTTVYSVRLPVTATGRNGGTYTYSLVLSVDQTGNPTVPPNDRMFGGFFGDFFGEGRC